MSPDEIIALYDEHASRLYALALRIAGDENTAADVLEDVFTSRPLPTDLAGLVHATRERALVRQNRMSVRSVVSEGEVPTPRLLVDEAFFRGASVADLAKTFSIDEEKVRVMLAAGMSELRKQVRNER